jgi:hypothetical protein
MPRFARLVLLLGFLILAAPAHAAVITLALEGSVDLSFFGGPSASTFAASMTWDSTVDPSRVDDMAGGTVAAYYQLVSTSVSLNANDVTNEFASPTLTLFDQPDVPKPPCCPARDHLVVEFPVPFPYLALGNGPGTLSLVEVQLSGLPTMSDSHALPSDVSPAPRSPCSARILAATIRTTCGLPATCRPSRLPSARHPSPGPALLR